MRSANKLKERLRRGDTVLGTWSVLPSPAGANVIAAAGFDFLIIDMEHGPASFETAEDMVRAVEGAGATPLVRVPTNLDWLILRGLEIGAHGVVVPQIVTARDARAAVAAVKYHPEGERGFSPFTRSGGYTALHADRLAARENAQTLSVLLVEGVAGVQNLDDILGVPEIDVIYLGTYDLSQSAGHPGQPDHPEVVAFVERCVERIRARGVAAGCLAQSQADVERWHSIGIQFIAYLADCALLFHACLDVRRRFPA
ncbi:MAG: aldolase [Chloroflexi bacterium]|nr:aldolase [Chloroflexota bacterium]MBI4506629.1 aldolase [Chloroflexota bacterium]